MDTQPACIKSMLEVSIECGALLMDLNTQYVWSKLKTLNDLSLGNFWGSDSAIPMDSDKIDRAIYGLQHPGELHNPSTTSWQKSIVEVSIEAGALRIWTFADGSSIGGAFFAGDRSVLS